MKYLRLLKINKLEKLRNYIFDTQIERIQFEQGSKNKNLFELLDGSKVYSRKSPVLYDFLKNGEVANKNSYLFIYFFFFQKE